MIVNSKTRKIHQKGFDIYLDMSEQVLHFNIEKELIWGSSEDAVETELHSSIKSIGGIESDFVSTSILIAKAKQFDDGLYATVEYLCQNGTEHFFNKKEMLRRLAEILKTFSDKMDSRTESLNYCRSYINAAARLGGQDLPEEPEIRQQAGQIETEFLSNELRSKPLGFYTWTEVLSGIFRQDRLLQADLDSENNIRILAEALSADPKIMGGYRAYLALVEKLTNPFPPEFRDLTQTQSIEPGFKYSFFPPSRSPETEFIKNLFAGRPIPEGYSLIDQLIAEIQNGNVNLTPKADSGWYEQQIYALEPFVLPEQMPEARKIAFSDTYKKELIDVFKASMALTRETHIKQLEIPLTGAMGFFFDEEKVIELDVYPDISVEPIATFYLRRAQTYLFVRELLERAFGKEVLDTAFRLTASREVPRSLLRELYEMESLFLGMYQIVASEIGLDLDALIENRSQTENSENCEFARQWIKTISDDPDVGIDNRMMVPVFFDIERQQTKVWAVLGYAVKPLSISFAKKPTALKVLDPEGKEANVKLNFCRSNKSLIYPISAEIYVDKLLNRDEFRALCDQHKTQTAILKALQSETVRPNQENALSDLYTQIPLQKIRETLYTGKVADARLLEEAEFYLAIQSPMPAEELVRAVRNRNAGVKISSRDVIDVVINSALPGIHLTHVNFQTSPIENRPGIQYFQLEMSGPYWNGIMATKDVSIYMPEQIPVQKVELFAFGKKGNISKNVFDQNALADKDNEMFENRKKLRVPVLVSEIEWKNPDDTVLKDVIRILSLINDPPAARARSLENDISGNFTCWFDGGAFKANPGGKTHYHFQDGTYAYTNESGGSAIFIRFANGNKITITFES